MDGLTRDLIPQGVARLLHVAGVDDAPASCEAYRGTIIRLRDTDGLTVEFPPVSLLVSGLAAQ